jgi:two-component system sensor histidine kinase HydH
MIDFLAPTARAQNVEVDWYPADLPPVPLDAEMFEKVLLNLMLNAEDAMESGGTLTLQARAVAATAGRPAGVELDVIDTGCGMPPEVAARAFRPFVTTKPGGTGLGLATARKVVEAHGGTIALQSEPGRGTKFTIWLPRGVSG